MHAPRALLCAYREKSALLPQFQPMLKTGTAGNAFSGPSSVCIGVVDRRAETAWGCNIECVWCFDKLFLECSTLAPTR